MKKQRPFDVLLHQRVRNAELRVATLEKELEKTKLEYEAYEGSTHYVHVALRRLVDGQPLEPSELHRITRAADRMLEGHWNDVVRAIEHKLLVRMHVEASKMVAQGSDETGLALVLRWTLKYRHQWGGPWSPEPPPDVWLPESESK